MWPAPEKLQPSLCCLGFVALMSLLQTNCCLHIAVFVSLMPLPQTNYCCSHIAVHPSLSFTSAQPNIRTAAAHTATAARPGPTEGLAAAERGGGGGGGGAAHVHTQDQISSQLHRTQPLSVGQPPHTLIGANGDKAESGTQEGWGKKVRGQRAAGGPCVGGEVGAGRDSPCSKHGLATI